MILITHDIGIVAEIAQNVMVMYAAGRVVEYGNVRTILKKGMPSLHARFDELAHKD